MNQSFSLLLVLLIVPFCLHAQSAISVPVKYTTTPTGNDVDDCAIWVHPADPAKSLVIVNDKGPTTEVSGLYVYNLNGEQLQKIPVYCPQNPDLRYNIIFGSDTMDVLVCADHEKGNASYNRIRVFRINPEKAGAPDGFLTEITTDAGIPTGQTEAYGHSLYQRLTDGALFSIVSANGKTDFTQIQLESDGVGKVKGTIVRTWGGSDIAGDLCEGICCDDELGFIYICDENTRVLKYHADPDMNINTPVGAFAQYDGIQSDREGINIYRCPDTTGYILLSSQGNNQLKVYDRVSNAFLGTVNPATMKDCDGLDVTAVSLGSTFPHGMLAAHLGSTAGSQFGFYDWSAIATGLHLAAPCDARRPSAPNQTVVTRFRRELPKPSLRPFHSGYIAEKLLTPNTAFSKGSGTLTLYDVQGKQVGEPCVLNPGNRQTSRTPIEARLLPGVYLMKYRTGAITFTGDLVLPR